MMFEYIHTSNAICHTLLLLYAVYWRRNENSIQKKGSYSEKSNCIQQLDNRPKEYMQKKSRAVTRLLSIVTHLVVYDLNRFDSSDN